MGKIDLGNGVQTTSRAGMATNTSGLHSGVQAGVSNLKRAQDNMLDGIRKVGETLAGISHDMADTTNAVRFSDYQIQSYDIDTNFVTDKLENDFATGAIGDKADFDERFSKYSKEAEAEKQKLKDKEKYAPSVLDKATILDLDSKRNNYAQMAGRFPAYQAKKNFETAQNNISDLANSKSSFELVVANMQAVTNNLRGYYSKDVCDKMLNEGVYSYTKNQAKNLAYSADRSNQKQLVQDWTVAIEKDLNGVKVESIHSLPLGFLNDEQKREIHSIYMGVGEGSNKATQAKDKAEQAQEKEALAMGKLEAKGIVKADREKFFEQVKNMKHLTQSQKIEAMYDYDKAVAQVQENERKTQENLKLEARQKAIDYSSNVILGKENLNENDLAALNTLRKGAESSLALSTKDKKNKVTLEQKQYATQASLTNAIHSYDPKADEDFSQALGLYIAIEATFSDISFGQSNLINNYQEKQRLLRELRENAGLEQSLNVEGENIATLAKNYIDNMIITDTQKFDTAIGEWWGSEEKPLSYITGSNKSPSARSEDENIRMKQFEYFKSEMNISLKERLKAQGFNTVEEISKFLQESPYMDRVKLQFKLFGESMAKESTLNNDLSSLGIQYDKDNSVKTLEEISKLYNKNALEAQYLNSTK